ncbi:heavy metal-associated domain-containing protein [Thiococcus pfennigii]|uniref:heavy metal-associated domain-containing protein n=1 Tax=Thiococcus pfennigii TaxID=1057 RepID=UPI001904667C
MEIQLVDVTLHISDDLDDAQRAKIEDQLRALDGVVSVHAPSDRRHLAVVQYNPEKVDSSQLLDVVKANGIRAELIGL